jgi:hypothetical protein
VRLHTRGDLDRHGHGYGSLSFLTFLSLGDESSPPPECGDQVKSLGCGSAEGEHKGLYARSEKLDLEQAISNGFGLPDLLCLVIRPRPRLLNKPLKILSFHQIRFPRLIRRQLLIAYPRPDSV